MSTPDGTGMGRPLRTAGLALLGVAAISLVIGLVALTSGVNGPPTAGDRPSERATPTTAHERSDRATPRPPSSSVPAVPTPSPGPAAGPVPGPAGAPGGPPTGAPVAPAPAPVVPGTGTDIGAGAGTGGGAGVGGGEKGDSNRAAVRVYNNSTTRGLAARAADELTAAGWSVIEVGNYASGRIPTTTVYYQTGTGQQEWAEQIGRQFGMRVEPRFEGIRDASPGLIVIVTNDYGT